MAILIISASAKEIEFLPGVKNKEILIGEVTDINSNYSLLIVGIGIASATYNLTKNINTIKEYSFKKILNIGIAGCFSKKISLTTVVHISNDQFGDLGAEDGDSLQTAFDLGWVKNNEFPFTNCKLKLLNNDNKNIQSLEAITVNKGSGSQHTISILKNKFADAQIESMEGAAIAYVLIKEGMNILQIRAISNYIATRNFSEWKITEAISILNTYITKQFKL